jgi:hypothetical protein
MLEERQNSALGLISIITSFFSWAVVITLIIIFTYVEVKQPGRIDSISDESPVALIVGIVFLGVMAVDLAALIVGIVGLFARKQRKLFCILGIIFSLTLIIAVVALMIIGSYS